MTGVELIVAALAAAATAGIASGTQDAYTGLKDLLVKRLAGRTGAVQALESRETDAGVWRARIGEDLTASGVAADEQILAAARAVLAQTDPVGARAGIYHVEISHSAGGAGGAFYAPVTIQVPPVPPATPGAV